MNEIVKHQPRNVTIIIEVKVPGSYYPSSESIAERAKEAVHREFRGRLKAELIGYEMRTVDVKSNYSSDYQMMLELAETEWPNWKIDSYNQNITSEHAKPLSIKLMNEIVKHQPRNVTIIIKVEVPGSYYSSPESIAERANSAVHREFGGRLKAELIGYEMRSGDKKSDFSSDYQMICVTSEHAKPLSIKLIETQRLGAIIACQTDHCINGIGIEEVLKYLTELSGSEVTKDNFSEVKTEFKDKIADDFRNLGGNA